MTDCNPVYTMGQGPELSLNQPEEELLDEAGVQRYQFNTEALQVARNSTCSSRTKHSALRLFFLKELVKEGKIVLHHVRTQAQLADITTKYLSKGAHRHLIQLINDYAV